LKTNPKAPTKYKGMEVEVEKRSFYFPLEPKKGIKGFSAESSFFSSKKFPLRVVAILKQDQLFSKQQQHHQRPFPSVG